MDNMTALVNTFTRAYHYKNNHIHIFADPLADKMLTDEEYTSISENMAHGISYFAPNFRGPREDALRFIVDHQLAPSVLARSAFCERAISNAVMLGCRQIIIFACGYDTFTLRTKDNRLQVFELDRPEMVADRQHRVSKGGLEPGCRQVCLGCDLALTGLSLLFTSPFRLWTFTEKWKTQGGEGPTKEYTMLIRVLGTVFAIAGGALAVSGF